MNVLLGKKKMRTFQSFLSGIPARDYVFQKSDYTEQIKNAAKMIEEADYILIGAGAGLSTAAGLTMGGKRFTDHFQEFMEKYGGPYMQDMYSAGFYPFPSEEAKWGYWSKSVMLNRVLIDALPLYKRIYELVKDKEYFVLTTNVDHQFGLSGFDEEKVFATQGDYGLIQCQKGCHNKTYDATTMVRQMDQVRRNCEVPSDMVPKCPVCGGPMEMNLRCDQYFVEDDAWHQADENFGIFLSECENKKLLLLELGAGFNTPTIIRFPFENLLRNHENICMIRLNLDEAIVPQEFGDRIIGINEDIARSVEDILAERGNENEQ